MHEKITTIEGLAAMIQRTMASKEYLAVVKQDIAGMKEDVAVLKDTMGIMREEMNATRVDVNYIRSTMNALISNDATQDAPIINLAERVEIIEDIVLAPA